MEKTQVTVTDIQNVSLMKDDDIRTWISLHTQALEDEGMKEHWEAIEKDLEILQGEWDLRNPLVVKLKEICELLKSIETQLKLIVKEKDDGTNEN